VDLEAQQCDNCRPPQDKPTKKRRCNIDARMISDAILGLSDGLTVPFALTAGLSSLGDTRLVVLGGLAELIAGAISMGLGGFIGTRSEEYVLLLHLHHVTYRLTPARQRILQDNRPRNPNPNLQIPLPNARPRPRHLHPLRPPQLNHRLHLQNPARLPLRTSRFPHALPPPTGPTRIKPRSRLRRHDRHWLFRRRLRALAAVLLRQEGRGAARAVDKYWRDGRGAVRVWMGEDGRREGVEGPG